MLAVQRRASFRTRIGTRHALEFSSEQPGQGILLEVLGDASNGGHNDRAVCSFKVVAGMGGSGNRPYHEGAESGIFRSLDEFDLIAFRGVDESNDSDGTLMRSVT